MPNPVELVKRHPFLAGGAVLLLIIVLVMSAAGGSQTVDDGGSSGPSDSQVAAGLQLQQISAEAGARAQEVAASREVALAQLSAQERMAAMENESAFNANQLALNATLAKLASDERVTTPTSTLTAQTRARELDSQDTQNKSMFDYLTYQTKAQKETTLAGYKAQVQASKPKSLFGMLFG